MAFACVPCVVIPLLLIIWKFIEPYVLRFWNPFAKKGETNTNKPKDITECALFASCPCIKKNKNEEEVTEAKEELVDDKKSN